MRQKLYCDTGGEIAYNIAWWKDAAHDEQRTILVELQKADIKSRGDMWCKHHGEFVERGCSEGCDSYDPRNKVSGRCRSSVHGLTGTGIKFTVHPDGRVEKLEYRIPPSPI